MSLEIKPGDLFRTRGALIYIIAVVPHPRHVYELFCFIKARGSCLLDWIIPEVLNASERIYEAH